LSVPRPHKKREPKPPPRIPQRFYSKINEKTTACGLTRLRAAGRGPRLPLPEGETIRFFLHWRDLAVGVGEHQVANLDHSSNRALAHLLDLLEGRRMPLAHLLGLLADDVVEDPDKAQLVFGEGRILPWQTERLLALLDPERVTADAVSEADGGAEDRQAG